MDLLRTSRAIFFVLFLAAVAFCDEPAVPTGYQKGTITPHAAIGRKSYDLITGKIGYQISNCADFQPGQVVDYRIKEDKVYILRPDGKDYKCSVEATTQSSSGPVTSTPDVPLYQKGTIGGFEVRRDTHIGGGGGGDNGTPGNPVSTWTRHAKVYELHGPNLIYKLDYCGAFQAGQFSPGQEVQFRVDGDRLYIVHDNKKEYSCQLEGTRAPDSTVAAESAKAAPASSAAPALSTARISITSVPDGADIEVDGGFSGNAPSDLEVPEGEHTISVKKSGYKDWQRKLRVVAGSNVHLNAEMERVAVQ